MRLRRPKISLRMMLIGVGLVCAYLACWEQTRRRGLSDVAQYATSVDSIVQAAAATSHLPFLVQTEESTFEQLGWMPNEGNKSVLGRRDRAYLWFFGYIVRLPFESKQDLMILTD